MDGSDKQLSVKEVYDTFRAFGSKACRRLSNINIEKVARISLGTTLLGLLALSYFYFVYSYFDQNDPYTHKYKCGSQYIHIDDIGSYKGFSPCELVKVGNIVGGMILSACLSLLATMKSIFLALYNPVVFISFHYLCAVALLCCFKLIFS